MPYPELPYEVLGEIFAACLPARDSDRLDRDNAPMLLCQVSSGWRAAALAEPRLWDTVVFPPSYDPRYARFIKDGNVQRWFDRTGHLWPLTFGDEPSEDPTTSRIVQFVPIVREYAGRFMSLSLILTKTTHLSTLRRKFPQDGFDQLQSISLCSGLAINTRTVNEVPLPTPFLKASQLSCASFSLKIAVPDAFSLPWSQITSINVDGRAYGFRLPQWHNVFETCTRLQQGTFIWPSTYGEDWPSSKRLTHPSLKSLKLLVPENLYLMFDSRVYDLSLLSSAVAFPKLQHLHFEIENGTRREIGDLPHSCREFQLSLKTLSFMWQGDTETANDAPVEASQFVQDLVAEPGVFTSLEHLVLPGKITELHDIVTILLSHPVLRMTILVAPSRMATWMRVMSLHEECVAIGHRMTVLSTDNCQFLPISAQLCKS